MAIRYYIDELRGMVCSEATGTPGLDDFYEYFKDLRNNKAFQHDGLELCDWRKVKNIPIDFTGMGYIASDCPWGERSHRAIVVSEPLMLGVSRMFKVVLGDNHGTIQLFQDIHAAAAWLDSMGTQKETFH